MDKNLLETFVYTMKYFSPHIEIAHSYWKKVLKKGSIAIDATCGNGHDAKILSDLILEKNCGELFLFDVQKMAIENTKELLLTSLSEEQFRRVHFFECSHESFLPFVKKPVDIIVYNLGYLPGSDKSIQTQSDSTLKSINEALSIASHVSITCYPGHEEGKREENALLPFLSSLSSKEYLICYHKWINRTLSPTLFWIEKKNRL